MGRARKHERSNDSVPGLVREAFGLKQWELAAYLGVTRTQLAMVELKKRELPTPAMLRLNVLVQHLPPEPGSPPAPVDGAIPPDPAPAPPSVLLPENPALRRRLQQCQAEAFELRHTLKELRARATPAENFVAAAPALRATPPPALATAADEAFAQQWLTDQLTATQNILASCGPAARAVREVRLLTLEFEIAEILRRLPPEAG